MIKGVIFDAFGTIVRISKGVHPYRRIIKIGIEQGRRPGKDDLQRIMTGHVGLREAARLFGIQVDQERMLEIEHALEQELASIEAYEDGLKAVQMLQGAGLQVAVCSNLAEPYGPAVERLYPTLNGYGFSYEVGAAKPDRAIYVATADQMSLDLDQCLMIGDSQLRDRDAPTLLGLKGHYLSRDGHGDFADLASFARHILATQDSGL